MTSLDMMSVNDEQEAESLMFHHLKLAARLFEVTGLNPKIPSNEFSSPAIQQWLAGMESLYPESET